MVALIIAFLLYRRYKRDQFAKLAEVMRSESASPEPVGMVSGVSVEPQHQPQQQVMMAYAYPVSQQPQQYPQQQMVYVQQPMMQQPMMQQQQLVVQQPGVHSMATPLVNHAVADQSHLPPAIVVQQQPQAPSHLPPVIGASSYAAASGPPMPQMHAPGAAQNAAPPAYA
jgi:hypothetical protein